MLVPARSLRVEYVDFKNVGSHREFRFRVCGADEPTEVRLRVALASFGPGGVRVQDAPDVCYQKLLRFVSGGEAPVPEMITIDDADLVSYREAHTPVTKHRSFNPSSTPPPARPPKPPRTYVRTPSPPSRNAVVPEVAKVARRVFEEGQRVQHAVFGVGVTSSSSEGHTVVHFDKDGSKTFVTSLLEMDKLSEPHMWETGPRGVNRACRGR
jgi:hypothetical protein